MSKNSNVSYHVDSVASKQTRKRRILVCLIAKSQYFSVITNLSAFADPDRVVWSSR